MIETLCLSQPTERHGDESTEREVMEIVGYIGFTVLVFLAVTWTIGVRTTLHLQTASIFSALVFVVAAVILVATDTNKLHSLWIIPVGFALAAFGGLLAFHFRPAFEVLRFFASAFANVVRIGIPAERIRAAYDANLKAQIEAFGSKGESKDE